MLMYIRSPTSAANQLFGLEPCSTINGINDHCNSYVYCPSVLQYGLVSYRCDTQKGIN